MIRKRPSTAAGHTTRKYVQSVEIRTIPRGLALYNNNMGGVDLAGQLASYYRIWLRSRKWWHPVLWWLLNQCITQAWIVHREVLNSINHPQRQPYEHWEFQRKFAEELVKLDPDFEDLSDPSMTQGISRCPGALQALLPGHNDSKNDLRKRCRRRTCGLDNKGLKTTWICSNCREPFCAEHILEHIQ